MGGKIRLGLHGRALGQSTDKVPKGRLAPQQIGQQQTGPQVFGDIFNGFRRQKQGVQVLLRSVGIVDQFRLAVGQGIDLLA